MRYCRIPLSIDYEKAGIEKREKNRPEFYGYLPESFPEFPKRKRPAAIICPGGGYRVTSNRCGEPVAFSLLAKGVIPFVLHYSVAPDVYPAALLEVGEAVACVRSHSEQWDIDPDKIMVWGFSAGGHLALSLGVYWQEDLFWKALGRKAEMVRPDALVLAYPVVSSGKYAHRPSFDELLGDREDKALLLNKLSLENHIKGQVPPVFLWATATDETVPAQNSMMLAEALLEGGGDVEFHLYRKGTHGLSLATKESMRQDGYGVQKECQSWLELACTWWSSLFSGMELS